jgi:hypothetical protein
MPSDNLHIDSMEALREMVKACMPTITKHALIYELVFHTSEPLPVVIGQIDNPLPNLEACVCFQKLRHVMHEAILYNK